MPLTKLDIQSVIRAAAELAESTTAFRPDNHPAIIAAQADPYGDEPSPDEQSRWHHELDAIVDDANRLWMALSPHVEFAHTTRPVPILSARENFAVKFAGLDHPRSVRDGAVLLAQATILISGYAKLRGPVEEWRTLGMEYLLCGVGRVWRALTANERGELSENPQLRECFALSAVPNEDVPTGARSCILERGISDRPFDRLLMDETFLECLAVEMAIRNSSSLNSSTDSHLVPFEVFTVELDRYASSFQDESGRFASSRVDEMLSNLSNEPPPGLDPELAEAFSVIVIGIRACSRLIASLPVLWTSPNAYRCLAGGVHAAADCAQKAYHQIEIRLRGAGGPNSVREILRDISKIQGITPPLPTGVPVGLDAILTRLHVTKSNLFLWVDGKGIIDRMLDQFARVPSEWSRFLEFGLALNSASAAGRKVIQSRMLNGLRI